MIGDRWYMRDPGAVRGLTLTVTAYGAKPGAEPAERDRLEESCGVTPDSRWTTVEALRAHHAACVRSGVLVSAEPIPSGVRTRRHFARQAGCPAFDLITEHVLS